MKTIWGEDDVRLLPPGEHDYFDRKSGRLLAEGGWRVSIGKAISAFANSGGGHLILGVEDNGQFTGVEPTRGASRTRTRDWLEQVLRDLVEPALPAYRVHEVQGATPSEIPAGHVLIVIDVPDSHLAPHQCRADKVYYYRAGGRSNPAPHFYLEALRTRLVKPLLRIDSVKLDVVLAQWHPAGLCIQMIAGFRVRNEGRVIAEHCFVHVICDGPESVRQCIRFENLPARTFRLPRVLLDTDGPIFPGLSGDARRLIALDFPIERGGALEIGAAVKRLYDSDAVLRCRAASESGQGEEYALTGSALADAIKPEKIAWMLPEFNNGTYCAGHGVYVIRTHLEKDREQFGFRAVEAGLENRSEHDLRQPQFVLQCYDSKGTLLHIEPFHMTRLPSKVFKWHRVNVEAPDIRGTVRCEIACLGDMTRLERTYVT